jgi:hypothetical protein
VNTYPITKEAKENEFNIIQDTTTEYYNIIL